MTERKSGTTPKIPKSRATSQSDDYSIWPSEDGIRQSAPWRLGSYGDVGALSDSDKSDLAERFGLEASLVETLSQELGYCLDIEAEINLVEVKRSKAIERANGDLVKALRQVEKIDAAARKLSKLLDPLSDQFAESQEDKAVLRSAKEKAAELSSAVAAANDAINRVVTTPGAAAVMDPFNKVHVWDKRRQYVVETCCYAWKDAGRPLTFTTNDSAAKGKKREGPLVHLIQAVVARVTDPSRDLSPETIRKDIDRLKKKLAAPDPLRTPPDRGIDPLR